MKSVCIVCNSEKIHSFQLRSDYGSFSAVNNNKDLTNDEKPYYVEGYFCEECDSPTLIKDMQ